MTVQLGSAYGEIIIDASGVQKGIGQAQGLLGGFQQGFANVGDKLKSTGKSLSTRVTLPLLGIGVAASKVAGDFESQMNILEIAARDSGTSLEDLSGAAIQVGADTELVGISASEAAEAMTNFYKAGLDTNDIFADMEGYLSGNTSLTGALRSAIDLAAASDLELAAASDLVAISMATYGIEAGNATTIADSFVKAADASVAEVSELGAALVNVGPTAAQFGWSLEDTNTALAVLSERGIRGAEAGTALKSMMTNLMRTTPEVQEMLKDLNVELYDTEGAMRPLPDIIGDLEGALAGASEEERNLAIQTLAGTYGMQAMSTLLMEGAGGWDEMAGSMDAAASAMEVAAVRTQGFNAAMEQLGGAIETLLIKVGMPLIKDFLTPLVSKLTEVMGTLLEQDTGWMKWALAIGAVAAVAGPVLMVLGTMATVIGALLSPIGLVVVAIAALGVAWATNFLGIRDATAGIGAAIETEFEFVTSGGLAAAISGSGIGAAIRTEFEFVTSGGLQAAISGGMAGVGAAISGVWNTIIADVSANMAFMDSAIRGGWATIVAGVSGVMAQMGANISAGWTNIKSVVSGAIAGIRAFVSSGFNSIKAAISGAMSTIQSTIKAKFDAAKAAVTTAVNGIKGVVTTAMNVVKNAISTATNVVRGLGNAFSGVADKIRGAVGRIQSAANDVKNALSNIKLPSFLTPGSPTPFEMGLRGIAGTLDKAVLPAVDQLQRRMERMSGMRGPGWMGMGGGDGGGGGGETVHHHYNLTVQTQSTHEPIMADFAFMQAFA